MAQNEHINESILSDEVRQNMKKEAHRSHDIPAGHGGFGFRHSASKFWIAPPPTITTAIPRKTSAALSGMKTALWRISARCSPPLPFRFGGNCTGSPAGNPQAFRQFGLHVYAAIHRQLL